MAMNSSEWLNTNQGHSPEWCSAKTGDYVRKNPYVSPLLPLLTPGSTFHTLSSSPTQAGYPTTQFNSDTDRSWHRPHRLKAQSHEMALPFRCQWQVMPPRLPTTSNQRKESESEVAQSCRTLCSPVDCSLPGSSIHQILQARILEWVAISFSVESSRPRDRTWICCITGRCFTLWATREVHCKAIIF